MRSRTVAIAGLVAAFLAPSRRVPALPGPAPTRIDAAPEWVPGEVLVKFKARASAQSREARVASLGHAYVATLDRTGWAHVKAAPGETVEEALAVYRSDPEVEYAQPNFVYHATAVPNDPGYGLLWGLRNTGQTVTNAFTQPPASPIDYTTHNPGTAGADMNLEKAWDHITDCSSVVVAVVDTGVNYNHEDLAGNMWNGGASYPHHGYDYVTNDNDPMDLKGHGTHVAGTVGAAGNNGKGTTGVCWKASIMAVRVLNTLGSGSTANIMQGIDFAVTHGAKVINMSLGGGGGFDQAYSDAISAAQAADVVVVVAAGNDGTSNDAAPTYPCNFAQPNLVCVAALDQAYQLASFSNFGATSVDVGAPGTNIVSTWAGTTGGGTDPLTGAGWTFTTSTAGGWARAIGLSQALADPSTYGTSGTYGANTDDRAYATYLLSGSVAVLRFVTAATLTNNDSFRLGYANGFVDPFGGSGTVLTITGVPSLPSAGSVAVDVSSCMGNCTIGFQLLSGPAPANPGGLAVGGFTITTLTSDTTSYNTENGTSMATPAVAGLAAMLRAYNPRFTYADVVGAIEGGGRSVASLAGKTTTGRAADAMGSLAFINPPTGLTATVH